MLEVIVGVALTALVGGLLVPLVKDQMDRRRLRLDASMELVETLAKRDEIDELLSRVTHELKLERNLAVDRILRR